MADGPNAKKALLNTLHTGSLSYNITALMKMDYENKIQAIRIIPLPDTKTNYY
jgi:hypothetical protein